MSWGDPSQGEAVDTRPVHGATAAVQVVEETDSYSRTIAGATVEAIRAGEGVGPNRVVGIPGEELTVTSSNIGFPMLTHSHIGEGRVVAAFMNDDGSDSRWCGVPLQRGHVIVYGPGVEHVAVNNPGLSFTFVITDGDRLYELAERLGKPFEPPARGTVQDFAPSTTTAKLGTRLDEYIAAAVDGRRLDRRGGDVLHAVAALLAAPDSRRRTKRTKGIDSRTIVHSCIDFAGATEHIPTIDELCLAAHVSERRLRAAFTEEFNQPPTSFFRAWALDVAHRHLRTAEPESHTVTDIATGLGFDHLGRFAARYRQMYGESPSSTLHRPA